MGKKLLRKLGVSALIGVGVGILFAPKKGSEIRNDIKNKVKKAKEDISNIDVDDVATYFEIKKKEIELAIRDLNAEKVKEIAKKKASDLEKECKKLIAYVKEKSEPILLDSAEALRDKAQKIIDKHETKEAKDK